MFGRLAVGIAMTLVVLTTAPPASATPAEDSAALLAEAESNMRAGEVEAAYLLALEADAISSSVASRWLVAISADVLGKHEEAMTAYRALLAEGGLPGPRYDEARNRLDMLEAMARRSEEPSEDEPPGETKASPAKAAPAEQAPAEERRPVTEDEAKPAQKAADRAEVAAPDASEMMQETSPEPEPGPTAIGLRVGGFVSLAGLFGAGGALTYYGLSSMNAATSGARHTSKIYMQRLIPVTAGLGAAALVLLPLGFLVDWDEGTEVGKAGRPQVSLVPGPGELGLGARLVF